MRVCSLRTPLSSTLLRVKSSQSLIFRCWLHRRFYVDKGDMVTERALIKKNYLSGWFAVDFVSVLPFNYIIMFLPHNEDEGNMARTTRFMRMTRIMRFARLIKLAKLTQLRDAIDTLKAFLNNVGVSAMELEFCEYM